MAKEALPPPKTLSWQPPKSQSSQKAPLSPWRSPSTQSNQTKAPPHKDPCHLPLLGDISFLSRICPSNHLCSHSHQHPYTLHHYLANNRRRSSRQRPADPHATCQPSIGTSKATYDSALSSQKRHVVEQGSSTWPKRSAA